MLSKDKDILIESNALSTEQWDALRAIADVIIPPSAEHGIPGAGDEAICKNILLDGHKLIDKIVLALDTLEQMANDAHASRFTKLTQMQREAVALSFQDEHADAANMLQALAAQCYYRDDRVLLSLGMEARAPFPEGYEVDEGDWSVLDPVRRRQAFHRPVS
jgi:hypothetical protein